MSDSPMHDEMRVHVSASSLEKTDKDFSSVLQTALMNVDNQLDELESEIAETIHRMGPVMGPERPSEAKLSGEDTAESSPIVETVDSLASRVKGMSYRIGEARRRLEI